MNAAQRLTQLREILFAEPSPEGWDRLVAIYHDWDYKDDLAVGIDYAMGPLEAWPEALRQPPESWSRVLLGEPKHLVRRRWERGQRAHPAMKLIRDLDLSRRGHHRLEDVSPTVVQPPRTRVGAAQLKHLAKAPQLQWITRLSLNNQRFGDDGAYELARAAHLKSLKHLSLESCELSPQGIWDLLEGEGELLDGLEGLTLHYNPIGDEGARGLARSRGLRRLGLNNCDLTSMGWDHLFSTSCLHQVEHLESCQLSEVMRGQWPGLRSLDISGIHVAPQTMRTLGQWLKEQKVTRVQARYVEDGIKKELRRVEREIPWLEVQL